MQNRWIILGVLFLVRLTMAFQFQLIASVAPLYMDVFGVGLGDIGLMIGLYLIPGLVIAYPGGAIGAWLGDKPAVTLALVLMVLGGAVMALVPVWDAQLGGRVIAGVGGVMLNVLMTKMVADLFAGREIATAMGLFVTSWPVGIALALLVGPVIAGAGGLDAMLWAAVLFPLVGLILFVLAYHPVGAGQVAAAPPPRTPLGGPVLICILIAGGIWGLYNAAFGMVFGFGPTLLAERGWSLQASSSTISLVIWLFALFAPLGGVLADRLGRPDAVQVVGVAAMLVSLLVVALTDAVFVPLIVLGLLAGLAAGPIMSLPSVVLSAGNRAVGMGVFFTVNYVATVFAPILAGSMAEAFGGARTTFLFGAGLLVLSLICLWAFRSVSGRAVASPAP